ncbi:MAG: hypothetical protein M3O09_10875 [Acidobacteriota bacterium]|nr:hypothetical protein [Acidobacteriota bacterium]
MNNHDAANEQTLNNPVPPQLQSAILRVFAVAYWCREDSQSLQGAIESVCASFRCLSQFNNPRSSEEPLLDDSDREDKEDYWVDSRFLIELERAVQVAMPQLFAFETDNEELSQLRWTALSEACSLIREIERERETLPHDGYFPTLQESRSWLLQNPAF